MSLQLPSNFLEQGGRIYLAESSPPRIQEIFDSLPYLYAARGNAEVQVDMRARYITFALHCFLSFGGGILLATDKNRDLVGAQSFKCHTIDETWRRSSKRQTKLTYIGALKEAKGAGATLIAAAARIARESNEEMFGLVGDDSDSYHERLGAVIHAGRLVYEADAQQALMAQIQGVEIRPLEGTLTANRLQSMESRLSENTYLQKHMEERRARREELQILKRARAARQVSLLEG